MTYGELFLERLRNILLVVLIVCLVAMCLVAYVRAREACDRTDAYIEHLDRKFGW